MLRVGLTGNVGAGKSTVVSLFASWGGTVIDADVLAREVVEKREGVHPAVKVR